MEQWLTSIEKASALWHWPADRASLACLDSGYSHIVVLFPCLHSLFLVHPVEFMAAVIRRQYYNLQALIVAIVLYSKLQLACFHFVYLGHYGLGLPPREGLTVYAIYYIISISIINCIILHLLRQLIWQKEKEVHICQSTTYLTDKRNEKSPQEATYICICIAKNWNLVFSSAFKGIGLKSTTIHLKLLILVLTVCSISEHGVYFYYS